MSPGEPAAIPRRTFVKGLVATAAVTATAGTGVAWVRRDGALPDLPVGVAMPTGGPGALFRQEVLVDEDEIHRSGCRRSAAPTAGYGDPAVAKVEVVGEDTRLRFPGELAGLVVPAAGLVPRDGWSARIEVRNASDVDATELPVQPEPTVLFTAGGVILWTLEPGEVSVTNFATQQHLAWRLAPGDWPAGGWQRFAIRWRPADARLTASRGDREADHRGARRRWRTPVPRLDPPGGTDDGVLLGGSPLDAQPFEVRGVELHRAPDAVAGGPQRSAHLTVDASEVLGPWSPGLSGTLAVHAGFDLDVGSTEPAIRDRQFALVYDEAGSELVRVGGPMNLLELTLDEDAPGGRRYGWEHLDGSLDALLADRPDLRLHLTLDFTPEALQPAGGDHRSPPTDPQLWAAIAVDVVAHVADRYGDQLHSVTLWNEPDYDEFWTGSPEQLYELWTLTQDALLDAGSPHLLGSPEYAFTPGIEAFFAWLADQPDRLRRSIDAIYVHDFQQDLRLVRERLRAARSAATEAGVADDVPLRITEYNLALAQLVERREDPDSWYATQPPHFTTEYAAAYAVHLLWEALDEATVDVAVFAAIGAQALFWGEQALVTSDGEDVRPYPALSTIALLSRLGGERIAATSDWPAIRALATRDDDGTVTVVYASFRPYRGFVDDVAFTLAWAGLPERFVWHRWQLDRDHLEDDRAALVGEGDGTDLPGEITIGALGIGAIRIVPAG